MPSSDPSPSKEQSGGEEAEQISKLEAEIDAKNSELQKLKDQLNEVKNGQRLNRRRRPRDVPAELKVEIVDSLPVENATQFLANVPNGLIIHHCAPRVRAMLQMIDQIAADYARTTLPAPNSLGRIRLDTMFQYTPEMDTFLRYGAAHCDDLSIMSGTNDRCFVGYPANFFNDLIKHCYETRVPAKAVRRLCIYLPLLNPAPWPAALVQPKAGEMGVEVFEVDGGKKWVEYKLLNKHTPGIAFKLVIYFEGTIRRQQMTRFVMRRVKNV